MKLDITKSDNREVSLFVSLILLLVYWIKGVSFLFPIALVLMGIGILIPNLFMPITFLLKFIGPKIQKVMSPIMLNVIYFIVVFPVGLIQKITSSTKEDYIVTEKKTFTKEMFERPF